QGLFNPLGKPFLAIFLQFGNALALPVGKTPLSHQPGLFSEVIVVVIQVISEGMDVVVKELLAEIGVAHAHLGFESGKGVDTTFLARIDAAVMAAGATGLMEFFSLEIFGCAGTRSEHNEESGKGQ
ncbi:hypothetical protein, partial [Thiolapillus sp.]|uniref:hypothetical protein n=1 Tax=Thiolapillus sp. TaxID=2017437 RepID=UPI003AF8D23F